MRLNQWPGQERLRRAAGLVPAAPPPQPGPPSYLFHPKAKKYSAALPALTTTRPAGRHLIAAVTSHTGKQGPPTNSFDSLNDPASEAGLNPLPESPVPYMCTEEVTEWCSELS